MRRTKSASLQTPLWSPIAYFIAILVIIFVAEVGVMYLLPLILAEGTDSNFEAFCDSSLLTLISAPLLWGVLIRPMRAVATDESRKFARLVNDARDAIILLNGKGEIDAINPAAEAMLECPADETQDVCLASLLPELFRTGDPDAAVLERLAQQTGAKETVLRGLAGKKTPVDFTVSSFQQKDGLRYTLLLRDVTDRKLAEEEKAQAHRVQVESARMVGKAEIATSVLHNVGNTLTCISVLSSKLAEEARDLRIDGLGKAVQMIEAHEHDLAGFLTSDSRGRQLPKYLSGLAAQLSDERKNMVEKLESLKEYLQHATRIVGAQQAFARSAGLEEETDCGELATCAIDIARASLERHQVDVQSQIEEMPLILVDRHKLMQILVNLLTNAKDAVKHKPLDQRKVEISVRPDGDRVRFVVRDNGVGIERENLPRIFANGFTTKTDGHGFGLHFSATAAMEMGGALRAQSNGLDQGATFTLDLPLKVAPVEIQG